MTWKKKRVMQVSGGNFFLNQEKAGALLGYLKTNRYATVTVKVSERQLGETNGDL